MVQEKQDSRICWWLFDVKNRQKNLFIEYIFLHHFEGVDNFSKKLPQFVALLFLSKDDNNLKNSFIKLKRWFSHLNLHCNSQNLFQVCLPPHIPPYFPCKIFGQQSNESLYEQTIYITSLCVFVCLMHYLLIVYHSINKQKSSLYAYETTLLIKILSKEISVVFFSVGGAL